MTEAQLAALIEHTYSRAEYASRVGLLRSFFEWVFFTAHETNVTVASIERYETAMHVAVRDAAFLRALPVSFWEGWTQENFYDQLERITALAATMPVLTITVAVPFALAQVDAIGLWARRSVDQKILVECITDPALGAGCQVVWQEHLHDYSFAERIAGKREALLARIEAGKNRTV